MWSTRAAKPAFRRPQMRASSRSSAGCSVEFCRHSRRTYSGSRSPRKGSAPFRGAEESLRTARHELLLVHVDPAQAEIHVVRDGIDLVLHVHARNLAGIGNTL